MSVFLYLAFPSLFLTSEFGLAKSYSVCSRYCLLLLLRFRGLSLASLAWLGLEMSCRTNVVILFLSSLLAAAGAVRFEHGRHPPFVSPSTTFPHLGASDDEIGILNVVAPPYNADPTGHRDSTDALQSAMVDGREQGKVIFLPLGTYLVSDTLNATEHKKGRDHPTVIVGAIGSAPMERPTIYVAANSERFMDEKNPRYVVHFWEDDALPPDNNTRSEKDSRISSSIRTNVNFNQIFQGINITVGAGNHGAIGVRLRGAQGSNIENVAINLGDDGFVGAVGASGSGGSHLGITVVGGKYGLDFRMAQPAPTITGAHLVNQKCAALIYAGLQTLTAVGLHIEQLSPRQAPETMGVMASVPTESQYPDTTPWLPKTGPCTLPVFLPDVQPSGRADGGQISLIDSILTTNQPQSTAITTPRNLYMSNVYVKGFSNIAILQKDDPSGPKHVFPNTFGTASWVLVEEAAFALNPPVTSRPYHNKSLALQFQSTIWKDNKKMNSNITSVHQSASGPPADLLSQHFFVEALFPSFQSKMAANVKNSPFNAKGDGVNDDATAIQMAIDQSEIVFLPKGRYLVSKTLRLKSNTKLVGVGRTLTHIYPPKDGIQPASEEDESPVPVVETYQGEGNTVIAFLTILTFHNAVNTYALLWQTDGMDSVFRQAFSHTTYFGFTEEMVQDIKFGGVKPPPRPNSTHPVVVISGGGRFYTLEDEDYQFQAPSYRHVLVLNSTSGLNFYQLNTEHSRGDANTEIRQSQNVRIFGFKSEANFVVLWIRQSKGIYFYGYGGNAAAFPLGQKYPSGYAQYSPSLFRVEDCSDTKLINLVDYPRVAGGNQSFFAGQGFDPHTWSMLLDSSGNFTTPPMDRPLLYWLT